MADQLNTTIVRSLPEWRSIVSESFVPLHVTTNRLRGFSARIRSRCLDQIEFSEITAPEHSVLRTPDLISCNDQKFYKLSLQLSGTCLVVQDNREAVLSPGDLALYDTQRPYTLAFDDDFRSLVMMFPQNLVDLPAKSIGQLTAVRLASDAGLGKVISPFLVELSKNLDQLIGAIGRRLTHNAFDLITTMFAHELGVDQYVSDPNSELLDKIGDFIDANLGNQDLSPSMIAAAHYISTRHLHNLFKGSGTTVASWIRTRRLERCWRELCDPVYADRPIAAVAVRWGFADPSHFSRIFRSAFGESPSALRNDVKSDFARTSNPARHVMT